MWSLVRIQSPRLMERLDGRRPSGLFLCCRPVRWIPVCAGGHIRDDSGTRDMETAVSAEKTGPPARTGRPLLRVCCVTVRRILLRRGSAGCVYEAAAPQSRGSKWISGERTVPQSDGCPDSSGKIPGRIMDAGHCALRGQSVRKRRNFIRNLSGDRSGAWRAFSRLHSNRFHSAYPHSVSNGSKDMHGFLTFKRVLPILPQIAKNRA